MKLRIGSVVVVFFSLVLSLTQLTFAQTNGPHLTLSPAAFICTAQGGCPNAVFDTALGAMNNAQGTWAANVVLPQAAVVSAVKLCGNFNEVGSSITATLDRIPLVAASGFPSATPMAKVESTGASNKTQCFKTTTIANATINNTVDQYYVVVVVPDNDGVIFTSVQVEY
ncbi:MAG TPA: hypothetical protein VFF64_07835 [Candidatus Eremiobacteraceae bacterium]|nr:hypothetical protein [Candidatus Eremiobacteraceae bacterium]